MRKGEADVASGASVTSNAWLQLGPLVALLALTGCQKGWLTTYLHERGASAKSATPLTMINGTDCPDGLARCIGGAVGALSRRANPAPLLVSSPSGGLPVPLGGGRELSARVRRERNRGRRTAGPRRGKAVRARSGESARAGGRRRGGSSGSLRGGRVPLHRVRRRGVHGWTRRRGDCERTRGVCAGVLPGRGGPGRRRSGPRSGDANPLRARRPSLGDEVTVRASRASLRTR